MRLFGWNATKGGCRYARARKDEVKKMKGKESLAEVDRVDPH